MNKKEKTKQFNINPVEKVMIDIGNSVFKLSYKDSMFQFDSKIKKINANTMDFQEAIIYNNECYAISQGDYVHDNFKAEKEGLEQFIFYGLSTIFPDRDNITVNLMLNLPVDQLANKDLLKSRLQNSYEFIINSPQNNIKNKKRFLTINKIGVVAESVASYYSLGNELEDFITILDIGSKTTNFATFTNVGINDIDKTGTLNIGIHNLYQDLVQYYKTTNHITYKTQDIDIRLRKNRLEIPLDIKKNFIDQIKNGLYEKGFTDYDGYMIKACGGGSLVLGTDLETAFSNCSILDNALFRNAIGSKLISEQLGF